MRSDEFPFESQNGLQDCAQACLKMLANYLDKPISALYKYCHLSNAGMSILDIRLAAESLGLCSLAFKCTMDDLTNESLLPAIFFWKECHFIVVYRQDEEHIFVADPALGRVQYTYDEFRNGWYLKGENSGILVAFEAI